MQRIIEPYAYTHKIRVNRADVGLDVLKFLTKKVSHVSVKRWSEDLSKKYLFLNGSNIDSLEIKLKEHDVIEHFVEQRVEPPVPSEVQIIDESEDYLAVVKPAPMPVHPCGRYYKNSLSYILQEKGYIGLYVIHRLDLHTSGLVLFAKSKSFARKAHELFASGKVNKKYLAMVDGMFPSKINCSSPIRRKKSYLFECHPEGKAAFTCFELVSCTADQSRSVVQCFPITGRTHQIRLHLKELGFPITDDVYYNPKFGERDVLKSHEEFPISLFGVSLNSEIFNFSYNAELRIF